MSSSSSYRVSYRFCQWVDTNGGKGPPNLGGGPSPYGQKGSQYESYWWAGGTEGRCGRLMGDDHCLP